MNLVGGIWRVLTGTGRWLYCWLRISGHWLGKLFGSSTTRFRRRLLRGKENKSLLRLGGQVHGLNKEGRMGWSEDGAVQQTLQALGDIDRKRREFETRLQGLKDRYRERVKHQKERRSSGTKQRKTEAVPESEPT